MGPTSSEVHVNVPLTNMAVAYMQDLDGFVADKIFPVVQVLKKSDRYFQIPKDDWFRTAAAERAPGTESAGVNFDVDNTPEYLCKVYAAHYNLADQVRDNVDAPLNGDLWAVEFVSRNLMLRREIDFFRKFMSPGKWQGGPNGGDFNVLTQGKGQWDTANCDPMKDVTYCQSQIYGKTGFQPRTLVLSQNVYDALTNNAIVMDRIKYTREGIVTPELLASLFKVDKLVIASAVLNTAQKNQTNSLGFMVSNMALLLYAQPAPAIMKPSAGYIFAWTGYQNGAAGALGNTIETFRMPHLKSDRFEGEMAYDMKMVCPDLGVLFTNILANP